jgi:hypothetical protein
MSFSIKNNRQSFVTSVYNPPSPVYGSFSSSVSQTLTQNVELELQYNTEDLSSSGVSCTFPSSRIYVQSSGVYKVLASLQCDKTTPGTGIINMYPSIEGIPVPNSATRVVINQALESLMTVEWFLTLNAGQYITIDVFSTITGARALAIPASPPVPLIPSIITTILKIA